MAASPSPRRASWPGHGRLQEDVRRGRQAQHDLPAPRQPVVDGDAPLAAVDGLEDAAEPELGRRDPGVVAGERRLDLDDLGAQVGEQERAPRAGQQPGEVQDADPRERTAQARRRGRFGHRVSRRRRRVGGQAIGAREQAGWSGWWDSNPRPRAPKARALPLRYTPADFVLRNACASRATP